MKSIFKEIRERAAKAAVWWGEANNVDVDEASAELTMFDGWKRGSVSYQGSYFGGRRTRFNVAYELQGLDVVVFAQGAPVERFSSQPWVLEWDARLQQQHRDSQARVVCEAIWANADRTKDKANQTYPLYGQTFNRKEDRS